MIKKYTDNGSLTEELVTEPVKVQALSGYEKPKTHKLLYLKRGPEDACMVTHGLYRVVKNSEYYQLNENGLLVLSESPTQFIDLEAYASQLRHTVQPPYLEIDAIWDKTPALSGESNNILGDNGRLFLQTPQLEIPCIQATDEMLAYYGAMLVNPGDVITFPDAIYPIWRMSIQDKYVQQFLMSEHGGGFYLEYHHDQPHYHHALNGEGHYLLAKWNEDQTRLRLTGFRIPNGHAVYTKKGAIHCDAGLVGDYFVGYTTSENCSTVLLRTRQETETMVHIAFDKSAAGVNSAF